MAATVPWDTVAGVAFVLAIFVVVRALVKGKL